MAELAFRSHVMIWGVTRRTIRNALIRDATRNVTDITQVRIRWLLYTNVSNKITKISTGLDTWTTSGQMVYADQYTACAVNSAPEIIMNGLWDFPDSTLFTGMVLILPFRINFLDPGQWIDPFNSLNTWNGANFHKGRVGNVDPWMMCHGASDSSPEPLKP